MLMASIAMLGGCVSSNSHQKKGEKKYKHIRIIGIGVNIRSIDEAIVIGAALSLSSSAFVLRLTQIGIELRGLKHRESSTVALYKDLCCQMQGLKWKNMMVPITLNLEVEIKEEDKALLLLSSLPESYEHLTTTLLYEKDEVKFVDVFNALVNNEYRKNDQIDRGINRKLDYSEGG
ncbi:hypothetical protein FNV43_RR15430 [Rhamnella rubrinervis]|uniref:Uncharacterized protein n=1 Tax=Rhamnella rubrinervis TaxID=2594499 RepID=A0A8K0E3E0_9ROSA|nr:hypothetical protein FNV43_RR15430 [Rhamnella rubrinervis]